jgi:DNA-binding transcriptional MerR regulator/methylmalonyl-CoA mutase cobalamin-binding subunit
VAVTETADLTTPRYPVRLVALRTGLSPHVLRAWERRYGVVTPTRSEGGQRLYSELDIARLSRLRRLSGRGHAIGQLASLSLEQLTRLDEEAAAAAGPDLSPARAPLAEGAGGPQSDESVRELTLAALRAIRELAPRELDALLQRAVVTLGVPGFLERVAVPLLRAIGHGWSVRSVSVAQEHMATAVIRRQLGWLLGVYQGGLDAPRIVVATPPGELHELGALMVAVSAAAEGWSVTYLGPDLPVADLLAAVRQTGARAVGLSLVHQGDASKLATVLREIREGLPPDVGLLVGGAGAGDLRAEAEAIGAEVLDSLPQARAALQRGVAAAAR